MDGLSLGLEVCKTCNNVVKIGDCYGHAPGCKELCLKCRRGR